ncbi:hypothetical protein A3D69_03305 [Candidatus Uhrbacteria bacterium RIFCSPHIGHO2_02_FULL_54_11]|nr:MAG: hypothetical protein A3D69_03305 [Candidatus Uhrbacteria bacterium RIFCSPHIGHO2_02_FULL_54_11]
MKPNIEPTKKDLLRTLQKFYPEGTDFSMVELAYDFAEEAHKGQVRIGGAPYIVHPTATAITLAEMKMQIPVLVAALLHDVPEDTNRTLEDIKHEFGDDVAGMVAGVTKLGKVQFRGLDRYVENLRKMFYGMAQDVRTIFIKFADRLHNLRTLDVVPEQKRRRIAREVLEIYAPIANRLGIGQFKGEFEDLAFQYVYPEEYQRTKQLREANLRVRERALKMTEVKLENELRAEGISIVSISGRVKRLYSLYKKLKRYDNNIDRIYDIVAIRIIVPKLTDCYATLGIIHKLWRPLKGRIKDYIAQPKPNGYQSLHTTVFGELDRIIEIQIRTQEMHEATETGITAHWQYKDPTFGEHKPDMRWLDELLQIQQQLKDKEDFLEHLEDLKLDAFNDRIFVFTPKGDVIDLPEGSTPVDFAYAIHTEVGNKCTSARINDQLVNLDAQLRSGDLCEIVVDKNRKSPNADWVKFVRTRQAKNKIRDASKSTMRGWMRSKFDETRQRRLRKKS